MWTREDGTTLIAKPLRTGLLDLRHDRIAMPVSCSTFSSTGSPLTVPRPDRQAVGCELGANPIVPPYRLCPPARDTLLSTSGMSSSYIVDAFRALQEGGNFP
jgi:hypothetical protein